MENDKLQVGDIVEILNLLPEQAQRLPNSSQFIGMRYRIEKMHPPGFLLSSQTTTKVVLAGFPENLLGFTTFFDLDQLLLYRDKTIEKIQSFILSIVEDRVSYGGWVSFSHLKTMGSITGADILPLFTEYCQRNGCTLTSGEHGESKASWADFRAFLIGEFPDD